jgi:hypothetical protein
LVDSLGQVLPSRVGNSRSTAANYVDTQYLAFCPVVAMAAAERVRLRVCNASGCTHCSGSVRCRAMHGRDTARCELGRSRLAETQLRALNSSFIRGITDLPVRVHPVAARRQATALQIRPSAMEL